ncbi:LysR family transcriptional regulator [Rubrivivax gelatinosus]|uniref:LysR family transcriptional regulator n=1 Tax=Rubrivivax gelatinosus TaxID=28068 RepID=UPI0019036A50|nr:LysR family transcriptional regulator [Rubrivivax gelatinosus]MBK1616279.1 LysR family transcriptional regulator [Rubrivivax gelatinosus]
MDRLDDLNLFLRVLDEASISAAARALDLSPAVASQRLARLEKDLGVRLLHRTTRRLHPTPEGLALAEQGRGLVADLDALVGGLRQSGGQVAGTLRVTTSATFGRLYLSPLLPEFLALHPQLRISVDLDDRVVDLVSAGYDLAIRIGALDDSTLVARRLAPNRRVLVASPDYLKRRGTPQVPADLAAHDCLLLTGTQGRQTHWLLADGRGGETAVRVRGRVESNFGELLRDAAVAGAGIALHSTWHVAEDLRAGRLQLVLPDYPPATTGIWAVMPQRRLLPPRVREFVEFLAGRFGDGAAWERGSAET